jgi:hypothetical protein
VSSRISSHRHRPLYAGDPRGQVATIELVSMGRPDKPGDDDGDGGLLGIHGRMRHASAFAEKPQPGFPPYLKQDFDASSRLTYSSPVRGHWKARFERVHRRP